MSSTKFYISTLFALVWICDGFIINFLQLIIALTIRPWNPKLYRKLNYYLIYTSWSQIVAMAQNWANCKTTVYYADEETRKFFGKEHTLILMNHKYEIDWLYCWFTMDNFSCLGSAKSYAKKALKWVPIIGWSFYFGEFIFLERSWEKDSLILEQSLDTLMEYTDYIHLLLFAEGTRFTKEKYESGVKFAKEKGLKILKYHLIPRTRGFCFTASHLKNKMPSIYNIQLEFDTEGDKVEPNILSVFNCEKLHGHLYIERIPFDKVPTDSYETLDKFLMDIYSKKDDLSEYFIKNKCFPNEFKETIIPRKISLFNMIFWCLIVLLITMSTLYVLFVYKFFKLLSSIVLIAILVGTSALFLLIRSTKAVRGSSYGTQKSQEISKAENSNNSDNISLRKRNIVTDTQDEDVN